MRTTTNRSLNLRQTVFVTLLLMLVSVAVGAAALHMLQWRAAAGVPSRLRVQAVADALAPQLRSVLQGEQPQAVRRWLQTQLEQEDVVLVGVIEPGQAPLILDKPGLAGRDDLYGRLLENDSFIKRVRAEDEAGRPIALECIRRVVLEGPGDERTFLLLALHAGPDGAGLETAVTAFVVPLVGVSLTGLVLGFWWLHRHVLGPLDQLARFAREPSAAGGNGADRSLDRPDQIGGIARALQALHTDVQEWRHRVADLERSMDRHIEARTNEMTKALSHIARQVATDALTGLYNRRALEKRFTDLFDQYRQAGHDVSVVMIDIDNFKLLNDTCGHAAGDDVLRFTGELLKQSTREKDLAVRFGGDEFALILGGVNASGAVQIAARVVALFAQHAKLVAATPRPSLSAGVASMRVHCPDSAEHLLQMADAALYDAKGCGKGSVKTYDARSRVAAPVGVL